MEKLNLKKPVNLLTAYARVIDLARKDVKEKNFTKSDCGRFRKPIKRNKSIALLVDVETKGVAQGQLLQKVYFDALQYSEASYKK